MAVTLGENDTVGVTEGEKETEGVTEGVAVAVGLLDGAMQLAFEADPTPNVICPGGQAVHADKPVAFAKVLRGHSVHAVLPVPLAKLPRAHGVHMVVGNVYKLLAVPEMHGAQAPALLLCPGLHGQLSAVAQVSVVAAVKAANWLVVGIAGQFHTSLCHTALLVRLRQLPAR